MTVGAPPGPEKVGLDRGSVDASDDIVVCWRSYSPAAATALSELVAALPFPLSLLVRGAMFARNATSRDCSLPNSCQHAVAAQKIAAYLVVLLCRRGYRD